MKYSYGSLLRTPLSLSAGETGVEAGWMDVHLILYLAGCVRLYQQVH